MFMKQAVHSRIDEKTWSSLHSTATYSRRRQNSPGLGKPVQVRASAPKPGFFVTRSMKSSKPLGMIARPLLQQRGTWIFQIRAGIQNRAIFDDGMLQKMEASFLKALLNASQSRLIDMCATFSRCQILVPDVCALPKVCVLKQDQKWLLRSYLLQ